MFYAILTSRFIFIAKTGFNVFSLGLRQVWPYSVLGDCIFEMKKGQGIKLGNHIYCIDAW